MSIVAELGDRIAALKPDEAKELRLLMKERWDIEPAGGGYVPPQQEAPKQVVEAEPTEFNVVIKGFAADKKIGLIKTYREITGTALGDAKNAVETPDKVVKEGVDRKTADEIKKKLEDAGATVEVKPA